MKRDINKKIKDLLEDWGKVIFIHYSSTGLYETEDQLTPRVTGISLHLPNFETTYSFGINLTADKLGINSDDVVDNLDIIESKLLEDFFNFVEEHNDSYWVHWNMNTINFGFQLLEHRYEKLHKKNLEKKQKIPDEKKRNLSNLIKVKFDHTDKDRRKMEQLMKLNAKFDPKTPNGFMTGSKEVEAFKNGEYMKILQSSAAKVKWFSGAFKKLSTGKLRVSEKETFSEKVEKIQDNPLYKTLTIIALIVSIGIAIFNIKNSFYTNASQSEKTELKQKINRN